MKIPRERRSAAPSRRPRASGDGFTLVEMLLVVAVVALLGGLLLPGANALWRTINGEEPDRIFLDVVNSARELALTGNRTVALKNDKAKDRNRFVLTWTDDNETRQRVLPDGLSLQLLQAKAGSSILIGGVLVESLEVPTVHFYANGTCDRFRVQLREGAGTPQIITFDPWTCAPIFGAEDKR